MVTKRQKYTIKGFSQCLEEGDICSSVVNYSVQVGRNEWSHISYMCQCQSADVGSQSLLTFASKISNGTTVLVTLLLAGGSDIKKLKPCLHPNGHLHTEPQQRIRHSK